MITSIDNWKVYRIVTCYLQVYLLSASLPVICKFTRDARYSKICTKNKDYIFTWKISCDLQYPPNGKPSVRHRFASVALRVPNIYRIKQFHKDMEPISVSSLPVPVRLVTQSLQE